MRRIDRQRLQKRADKLFSVYIKQRDSRCLRCSSQYRLECAHIVGRANKRLRYDPMGSVTLCNKCHIEWAHREPDQFKHWIETEFNDRWEYVERVRNEYEKPDYEEIIRKLKSMIFFW